MRVDKFLWCVRYFKTRSIATTACKKGQVKVNGDVINYELIVNDIPASRIGAKLVDIYRTDITPKEAFETQEQLKYAKDYYRKKGTGRPTKKDRRDIEDFNDEHE